MCKTIRVNLTAAPWQPVADTIRLAQRCYAVPDVVLGSLRLDGDDLVASAGSLRLVLRREPDPWTGHDSWCCWCTLAGVQTVLAVCRGSAAAALDEACGRDDVRKAIEAARGTAAKEGDDVEG